MHEMRCSLAKVQFRSLSRRISENSLKWFNLLGFRYRLQTISSLAGVSLMLRLLWACLRWDDMAVKPSSAGTTRTGNLCSCCSFTLIFGSVFRHTVLTPCLGTNPVLLAYTNVCLIYHVIQIERGGDNKDAS